MRPAFLVSVILSLAAGARATTVIMPADDQMIISSRAIVRARVTSQVCGFDSRHDIVFTYVTLRIEESLKGDLSSREIVLKEPGGQVGNLGSVFFGSPRFTLDEDVVLYLDTWPDGSLRVHDMFLGKFTILRDEQSGQLVAVRGVAGPNVDVIPPAPVDANRAHPAQSTSRMELSRYLRLVREKTAANAEQSREFERQFYSGQKVLAEPPDYQNIARSGGLEPQFHLFDNARWFEPDSGQPVRYLIDPDQAPNPQVAADVDAAMKAWSTVQGCSLRVVDNGSAIDCLVDGRAVADFDNCRGFFSADVSCSSLIAESGFLLDAGQTKVVNGTTFNRIVQGFVSLNPFAACYFGIHCSLQEILTHEMGHTLGMNHSWDPSYPDAGSGPTAAEQEATMYYQAHFDGRCASLKDDDMNGIRFIYPGTPGGGSSAFFATDPPLPDGVTGAPYNQPLSVTGGAPPFAWSMTWGSLPPGLGLDPTTGTISGIPAATGSFNFMVTVSDSGSPRALFALNFSVLVVGPEALPQISSAKYKPGSQKLIIDGQNFDPAAVVLVNGVAVTIRSKTPIQLVVKPLALAPGTQTITVVNPNGLPPAVLTLIVN